MKSLYKTFLATALLSLTISANAQNSAPTAEATRVMETENKVKEFIGQNIEKYRLSPELIDKIKREEPDMDAAKLEHAITSLKRAALRNMYYEANKPSTARAPITDDICENGGFEQFPSTNFEFNYATLQSTDYTCDLDVSSSASIFPSGGTNNFNDYVTVVDDDASVSSGGDPVLAGLSTPIILPRVNNRNNAIKLNDNLAGWGVTSMTKYFVVSSDYITYHFSLVMENPQDHAPLDQPHFIVRLYNSNNEIVSQRCIVSDVNNTQMFIQANPGATVPLLYTGWQCDVLNTDNMQVGEEARLEFIITDCGQGAHYATAYIDDICVTEACKPVFGRVNLTVDPSNNSCPEFPIQICGTYTLPESISNPGTFGTLDQIQLNIIQNGVVAASSDVPVTLTSNTFCFEFDETDFAGVPAGQYEFQAVAKFSLGTNTLVIEDSSENVGPDLSFENCCVDYLTITNAVTSGQSDHQEADIQITALNAITSAEAIYHAGDEILLIDGFLIADSKAHIYIQPCSGTFLLRQPLQPHGAPKDRIELIETESSEIVSVYPNPAKNLINISAKENLVSCTIYTLDGKTLLTTPIEKGAAVDLSNLEKGLYIMALTLNDGTTVVRKIIKE